MRCDFVLNVTPLEEARAPMEKFSVRNALSRSTR